MRLMQSSRRTSVAFESGPFTCAVVDEESIALRPHHFLSPLVPEVVHGKALGRVPSTTYEMALPEVSAGTSFFVQRAEGGHR